MTTRLDAVIEAIILTTTTRGLTMGPRKMFLVSKFDALQHDELWPVFAGSLPKSPTRLCYIPTAMYAVKETSGKSPGQQRQRARRDAKGRRDRYCGVIGDVEAVTLDLWDKTMKHTSTWRPTNPEEAITEADLLVVEGGNTFWLWANMEEYASLIQSSSAVYVGISAGAIVAGRHVSTALWKGWDDPNVVRPPRNWSAVRGLDLAQGRSFFPHYTDDFKNLVDRYTLPDLVLLDEDGGFHLDYFSTRRGGLLVRGPRPLDDDDDIRDDIIDPSSSSASRRRRRRDKSGGKTLLLSDDSSPSSSSSDE